MALLSAEQKYDRENDERPKAWNKLRRINEYIHDFEDSKNHPEKIKAFELKWGFPPHDPANENPSFEFMNAFSDYDPTVSRLNHAVVLEDVNSDKITVKIDVHAPISVIIDGIKTEVENVKQVLKIQKMNSPSHHHLDYLVGKLVEIGLNDGQIMDRLIPPELMNRSYDDPERVSLRKQILSRIKQARTKS